MKTKLKARLHARWRVEWACPCGTASTASGPRFAELHQRHHIAAQHTYGWPS